MSSAARGPLFVVLGATGDLMQRKLLPALEGLTAPGAPLESGAVLGVARSAEWDDAQFQRWARAALEEGGRPLSPAFDRFAPGGLFYHALGFGSADDYVGLRQRIESVERERHLSGDRVIYLALPLFALPGTIAGLGGAGLHRGPGWTRIVVEKPFGRDLESARHLNDEIHQYFSESQIFRIDHYLGKETVQNLLVFRFANLLFESLWNRDRVDRVEITVAEEIGIEGRATYYEESGALRDMVQNHLTQLLTLMAMEVPAAYEAESIRNEKVKVLRSIAPVSRGDAVFGQYERSGSGNPPSPAYREEGGVRPTSTTETYVALRLRIENWRWHGVPFYLRTGKRLPRRATELRVCFRRPPVSFFQPFDSAEAHANELRIRLQPDEGFDLIFAVKSPGESVRMQEERMHFRYTEAFRSLPEDYQKLLSDVLKGDPTLFVRSDEVEASWRLYSELLANPPEVHPYPAGTWGPPEANALLEGPDESWATD